MRHSRVAIVVGIISTFLAWVGLAAAPEAPAHEQEVLGHLNETAAWYQRVVTFEQGRGDPAEVLHRDAVGRSSRQALDLAFEYARAEAARVEGARASGTAAGPASSPATAPATGPATASSTQPARGRRLEQAAATAAARVTQLQADLEAAERRVAAAPKPPAPELTAERDRIAAELNLATVRRDVLQRLAQFRDGSDDAAGATLLDQIDAIQRSIPAAPTQDATAAATAAAVGASAAAGADPSGIFGLVSQMFQLSRRMHELKDLADLASALRAANERLRAPLRAELMAAVRRADAVGAGAASSDGAGEASARDLDALAAQFKQLSDAAVPLGRQSVLLDQARTSLLDWRAALGRQYSTVLRTLLVRLAITAAVVAGIFIVSVLWRRATFRYVHDPRRRRQFMLIRRLVVGASLALVAAFSFVTEFGSLATFAGILTAGIAVSLQTLILSGVAYFFFVGRYGVRVGDRVTVAGVTGEVLDTGLFRLYLMELGGTRRVDPTGRVVVFSNSVLFQPQGFFKQVPGADYVWHELSLTLSPETDHKLAEKRLLAAVEAVFAQYRERIDRQHAAARRSGAAPPEAPRPSARLRFVEAGLEITLRYPVETSRASEIEDEMTRRLLATIEEEPRLRLVARATAAIQPVPQAASQA